MWKKRKLILFVALAMAVIIGGVTAGVTFAQSGNETPTQTPAQTRLDTFLDKIAQIYKQNTGVTLDVQQLKTAITQAQKEQQNEVLQNWLQNLVTQGRITQQQADQYLQWWQSRPDTPLLGTRGGMMGGALLGGGRGCWGGSIGSEAPGS